tara:strand:- start:1047 stop:1319 length:273 start_codon:yes stop_codon:yes gene_type:complete
MKKPILYIKAGCPWCLDAMEYFRKENIVLEIKDVRQSDSDMNAMKQVSGQSLTPTFVLDKCVIADFSVDEFKTAIRKHPDTLKAIGLKLG